MRVLSYVRDTAHFLTFLDQLGRLPDNAWLVTLNVTQLYTQIPNPFFFTAKEALLVHDFRHNPNVKPSNDNLVQLMEFVLTKINFHFNGDHYLQIASMSVGTKMAPRYANVFMRQLKKILSTPTTLNHYSRKGSSMTVFASGLARRKT